MAATILVVEDEALIADDIQRTLVGLGYDVPVTAATGKEAIRAAEEGRPALVLMDIKLRGAMDGIDAAREIRGRFGIPIVYLTSHSDEATLARAKETQPHGYLLKPFNDRELRTAIEVALHKHQLEARLGERERWFSTTLQSIGDAVIATDPSEAVTFINAVAEQLVGLGRGEVLGKKLDEVLRLVDASGAPIESPVGRALRSSFAVRLPDGTSLIREGGARIEVDDSAAPIVDDHGKVLGGVIVFREVTDRRKLEQRLAHSERLAAIGTMAAETAHEINNPLGYVLGNVGFAVEGVQAAIRELAKPETPAGAVTVQLEEILGVLKEAAEGAERVRKIVLHLNRFSRAEDVARSVLDLPNVLDVAAKMTATSVRRHARLRLDLGTTPFVEVNEGQLTQVFTNLLINAAQAIGEGDAERHEIRVRTYTDERGRAVAEVRDTGPGIAPEVMGRLFDPFFTTKPAGVGTGLGLSICRTIVANVGGEITVESELGKGATFRVALPPAVAVAVAPTPPHDAILPPARRGKILVVDDEPALAKTVQRMLRAHHDVTILTEAREAAASIAAGEAYDVIFCDVMMPSMTGMDLHEALAAGRPEQAARMVFMTGGTFSERAKAFLEGAGIVSIAKPFSVETVQAIARDYVK